MTTDVANVDNLKLSSSEEKALDYLGQGIEPAIVASALGLSESRISQLISNPYFAAKVLERRQVTLAKHVSRDQGYDSIEDTLQEKLKDMIPLMFKPMEVLAAVRIINQVKRRSVPQETSGHSQQPVVPLVLPIQIINQFRLNAQNTVIEAGQQQLITVQSGQMKDLLNRQKENSNEQLQQQRIESS